MNYQEMNERVFELNMLSRNLENYYTENGGEVDEVAEAMERNKELVADLLNTEGIDMLGRWLKSKEDEIASLKAERDFVNRRIKSVENTIAFIKAKANELMSATEQEVIKGAHGYAFKAVTSTTTSVDRELLEDRWQALAETAARQAGIPEYVTIKLNASKSAVPEGQETPPEFIVTSTPTVRFTKPKKSAEMAENS